MTVGVGSRRPQNTDCIGLQVCCISIHLFLFQVNITLVHTFFFAQERATTVHGFNVKCCRTFGRTRRPDTPLPNELLTKSCNLNLTLFLLTQPGHIIWSTGDLHSPYRFEKNENVIPTYKIFVCSILCRM